MKHSLDISPCFRSGSSTFYRCHFSTAHYFTSATQKSATLHVVSASMYLQKRSCFTMTSNQDDSADHTTSMISTTSIGSLVEKDTTKPLPVLLHAHWDCFSGAAGDMMFAACLDAVAFMENNGDMSNTESMSLSQHLLQKIEESIKLGLPDLADEFSMECKRVWRGSGSITAMHVTVHSKYKHKPTSVPTPYLLSIDSSNNEEVISSTSHHDHVHEHHHHHHHHHSHNDHNHKTSTTTGSTSTVASSLQTHDHDHHNNNSHVQGDKKSSIDVDASNDRIRNLPEIRDMLMKASELYIPKWVRDHAIAAFTELAKAEAAVHGASSMDNVHFHEVGAIDSIVDTVGTLLALHYLNVTSVSCSRLPLGEGMVSTAHGVLPVPAPATLRLMAGMPITSGPPGRTGELVTPTAASLLRVLVHRPHDGRSPNMTLHKVGIGAGTKDFVNHPNIIRLLIGEKVENK